MPYYPDIAERISELAAALKTNKVGLGRLAGVSKTASGNWFSGKARPEREALANLKKYARVNDDWVINGKGEMFLSEARGNEQPDYLGDKDTQAMLKAWNTLTPRLRRNFIAIMESIVAVDAGARIDESGIPPRGGEAPGKTTLTSPDK